MEALNNYGENVYNGLVLRQWLEDNVDISVYIAGVYLTFVFAGPHYIEKLFKGKQPVGLIKKAWMLWNFGLSIFSLYGVIRIVPVVLEKFQKNTMYENICIFHPEEFYTTKTGFAVGLFAISKLPEFGDTFFLLMTGKKSLPFLQWFHHVTTYLFAWMSYQMGSSIFIYAAAMNYFVHTIMYFYFALAEAGLKNVVKPFGIYITALQITQMVGGLFFTGYSVYHNYRKVFDPSAPGCPGTDITVSRTQLLVYIFNFYLFSEMFVKSYILPPPKRAEKPAAGAEKKKSA
ncbi:fatty acid elongase [Strigomonas culicis]|uniref:Elongation of fatty acids protein n=1 Tax=Strigomonas culicis TaxID=28005 RepID=S9V6Y2_9TRYP|nr:fatty acid elongase [Strigomonas culicis]EPY31041.1 fatty acid elongase [Strigomonas culicis]EPY36839.1 fatty acid elongase [Strigomonas culicis]|eukprot:EPY23322.1 fatty acid elongase [Strigomonas culicis]